MKFHCNTDKPSGYNQEKHKFGKHWCYNFLDRKGLSIRRKTNKKKLSIFEKLHKIKNYHHYCVYELVDDDISSEESSSDSESEEEDDDSDSFSELITSDEDSSSESE